MAWVGEHGLGERRGLKPPPSSDAHPPDMGERRVVPQASSECDDGLDDTPMALAFSGLVGDLRRRLPHFVSDYRDGLHWKTLSAGIFTFLGVMSTTVSLGYRMQACSASEHHIITASVKQSTVSVNVCVAPLQSYSTEQLGITEYLLMNVLQKPT